MKTTTAIAKGILLGAIMITIASLTGCTASENWDSAYSPLDQPGHTEDTVQDLHLKNLKNITSNPAYR